MPKIESNILRVLSEKKIRDNPVRIQIVPWGAGTIHKGFYDAWKPLKSQLCA